jgi:hypothetical protein
MGEIGGQRRLAVHGDGVTFMRRYAAGRERQRRAESEEAADNKWSEPEHLNPQRSRLI